MTSDILTKATDWTLQARTILHRQTLIGSTSKPGQEKSENVVFMFLATYVSGLQILVIETAVKSLSNESSASWPFDGKIWPLEENMLADLTKKEYRDYSGDERQAISDATVHAVQMWEEKRKFAIDCAEGLQKALVKVLEERNISHLEFTAYRPQ